MTGSTKDDYTFEVHLTHLRWLQTVLTFLSSDTPPSRSGGSCYTLCIWDGYLSHPLCWSKALVGDSYIHHRRYWRLVPALGLLALGQVSCRVRTPKRPYGEAHMVKIWGTEASSQQPCECAIPEADPSAPAKPSLDCSPNWHPGCTVRAGWKTITS